MISEDDFPMTVEAPSLAIVICTFKRPELLRLCLRSIAAQGRPDSPNGGVKVYVVDNSDEGDAQEIVRREAARSPWPLVWLEAHPANISVARNAGVAAGKEDFVAFVDDDQTLDPGWLAAVFQAIGDDRFDAWLGRVVGLFEAPERTTPAIWNLFSRELTEDSGFELFAFGPGRSVGIALATNNCVFRRATCLDDARAFDPSFGKGGGEDFDLFCRLQRRGRRFVWLAEATAREFVPASRCDRSYMRRRFYAGGQAFAEAMARGGSHPSLERWLIRAKACVQAGLLTLGGPAALWSGADARTDYVFRWAGVLGKLSFGETHPLYQQK
jgi:succinoglycan biosynthesis protein ExoM